MKPIFDRYDLGHNTYETRCNYVHGECEHDINAYHVRYLGKDLDVLDIVYGDNLEHIIETLDRTISTINSFDIKVGKNIGKGLPIYMGLNKEDTPIFRTIKGSSSIDIEEGNGDDLADQYSTDGLEGKSTLFFKLNEGWMKSKIHEELGPLSIKLEELKTGLANISKELALHSDSIEELKKEISTKVSPPAAFGEFYLKKDNNGVGWRSVTENLTSYFATFYFPNIYKPEVYELDNSIGRISWQRSKRGVYIGSVLGYLTPHKCFIQTQINQDITGDNILKQVRGDRLNDNHLILYFSFFNAESGKMEPYDPPHAITANICVYNFKE